MHMCTHTHTDIYLHTSIRHFLFQLSLWPLTNIPNTVPRRGSFPCAPNIDMNSCVFDG